MLEAIRTFFGKERGRGSVVVDENKIWHCTECKLLFLSKQAGEKHSCEFRFVDSIVALRKKDEAQ